MLAHRKGRIAGIAAIVIGMAASFPVLADQLPEGPYFGVGGGLNLNGGGDIKNNGVRRDLDTDLGFVGLGSFGYAFGNGLRAEIEGGHRRNTVEDWGGTSVSGHLSAWHAMVNALYDFPTGNRLSPYIGAGIGTAVVSIDAKNTAAGVRMDDTDVSFAYQAIIGMGYDIMDNLAVTADYRFLHAVDLEHQFSGGGGGDPGDSYLNHSFVLGLRYAFGVPAQTETVQAAESSAAVEAPEPPPVVPNSYLVFFAFDSHALTPEATGVVDTAANNALQVGPTRIEVTGHTDRAGPESYNMILSQRRAEAVMTRLVAQGVPRDAIAVFAKGEDEPLIPTGDGVSEAQNRRVEIILL